MMGVKMVMCIGGGSQPTPVAHGVLWLKCISQSLYNGIKGPPRAPSFFSLYLGVYILRVWRCVYPRVYRVGSVYI
jgi:hypothetical protein